MKRVLFVCTANICRSPMAQAIFDTLAEDTGLLFRAHSAGTAALVGESIAPNAIVALKEMGIYPGAHQARQADPEMLAESDLVLAMTRQHVAALRGISKDPEKVCTLPEYAAGIPSEQGISDPYGQTMFAYRSSVRQIYEYVDCVVTRLREECAPPSKQRLLP